MIQSVAETQRIFMVVLQRLIWQQKMSQYRVRKTTRYSSQVLYESPILDAQIPKQFLVLRIFSMSITNESRCKQSATYRKGLYIQFINECVPVMPRIQLIFNMIDEEEQRLLQNNHFPDNKQAKKNKHKEATKSCCEIICLVFQCLILILLVALVIKFALIVNHPQKVQITPSPPPQQEQTPSAPPIEDIDDENMLKFLLNPEEHKFEDTLEDLVDDLEAEELFEELEFEAIPLERDSGWLFRNGLRLIVKEIEQPIAKLTLLIANGYDDDLEQGQFSMLTAMRLLGQRQCDQKVEVQVRAFDSGLQIAIDSAPVAESLKDEISSCLQQLSKSLLETSFTQEQVDRTPKSMSNSLEERVELVLDVILKCAENQTPLLDASQLSTYFKSVLQQRQVELMVESNLMNQDVYMMVSDTDLISLTLGREARQTLDLEQLEYNLIKLQSDSESTILIYPVKRSLMDFFVYLLQLRTINSFSHISGIDFEILRLEYLTLRTQNPDWMRASQLIYSFASFLKRLSDKVLMNAHKDYQNLRVLNSKQIDEGEAEFSKKYFNQLLDQVQQGIIVVSEGQYTFSNENHVFTREQFYNSNIVNKQFEQIRYANQLFDYTQIAQVDETFVGQLKLPNLSNLIPIKYNILQLYTTSPILPTEYRLANQVLTSSKPDITPKFIDNMVEPLKVEFTSSKKYPCPERVPLQITQDFWWQFDNGNQVFMGLLIHRPVDYQLAKSKAILKIVQQCFEELNQFNDALSAGYKLLVESEQRGLSLVLSGWKGAFNQFQSQILGQLEHLDDEYTFETVKKDLSENFKKYYYENQQFYLLQYSFPKLMLRPVNDPQDIIQELNQLKFDEFTKYLSDMFGTLRFTAFISGNLDISESQSMLNKYQPNTQEQITKTLKVDQDVISTLTLPNASSEHSFVRYYQTGLRDIKTLGALLLLQQYFQENESKFTVRFKSIGCVDGLLIYGQGSETPDQLDAQFTKLAKDLNFKSISQMHLDLQFERSNEYIWDKILYRNYQFQEMEKIQEALATITEADLKQVFESNSLTIYASGKDKEPTKFNQEKYQDYGTLTELSYYNCQYQHQSQ